MNQDSAAQDARPRNWLSEDWTAVTVGLGVLVGCLLLSWASRPKDVDWEQAERKVQQIRESEAALTGQQISQLSADEQKALAKKRGESLLKKAGIAWEPAAKKWLVKVGEWVSNPWDAMLKVNASGDTQNHWPVLLLTGVILGAIGAFAVLLRGNHVAQFALAFPALFFLAASAYLLAAQSVVKNYNFEFAIWALMLGMLICNTVGVPNWLKPAVQGELYIKIGLVLLGAEVLFSQLLALGIPGIFVSWVVTPIVLVGTFIFGQRVLKVGSPTLNIVISADMSVCGVSAAIATAAACKAKKEELSLAIGLSLTFTAVMMVVMPRLVLAMGMDPIVAGAWIGGTIDSTGAVAAAGQALGIQGMETAVTVKMIQNILIGVIALGVAIYWSRTWHADSSSEQAPSFEGPKMGISEIWRRFPRFVLGFLAASLIFSTIFSHSFLGASWTQVATKDFSSLIRAWLFCLAFVSIGLSTNFRELYPYLKSGKPLVLYLCGQAFNLVLTLIMAYLMFGILFKANS